MEHQESLDVIMERDKFQDKAINKLTDENKKLMKLVEDLTATKSDKKATIISYIVAGTSLLLSIVHFFI